MFVRAEICSFTLTALLCDGALGKFTQLLIGLFVSFNQNKVYSSVFSLGIKLILWWLWKK